MYLRESKHTKADGRVVRYLQLAENVWNAEKGRSQASIIHNCGRSDDAEVIERLRRLAGSILRRCRPEEIVAASEEWHLICAWPYGDLYVLENLWKRLGVDRVIRQQASSRAFEFDIERALFALVANRACAPASELYCHEQWLKEDVHIEGTSSLQLHHLYRAMDFLEANREAIEHALFHQVADLFNLEVDILFYDTTSLHFEIDDEDEGDEEGKRPGNEAAGRKSYLAPRKRGYSKNGRRDAPQIVVGLAVTREGFPVRHWVFPGNTVDVSTVARIKEDLRGWKLSRCLFVGDAGMVSRANLQTLSQGGSKYLLAMPLRRGDEISQAVLSRPGRYHPVAEHLEVKEVTVGEGERRRRYAVCFNPQEAKRQRLHREKILHELEAELESLSEAAQEHHSKRVCALRTSARYGRLLKETKHGLALDRQAIAELERCDGKFVVHSNDDSLSAEDMALGYKQQQRVEEAWRTMKSGLKLRPVYHWAPHRIHAHVAITVLSLLLERTAEHRSQDTWRNIRDDLKQIQLALLLSPHGRVWQVTDPSKEAANRLKILQISPPKPILNLD
jgi:transposase